MKRFFVPLILLVAILAGKAVAAPSDSCQASKTKMSDGHDMFFRLYVPKGISADKRYPLVMMLHGIGECGSDNRVQVDREDMSKQWSLDSVKTKYQAFVLYPQCPSSSYEWGHYNTGVEGTDKGYAGLPAIAAVKVIDSLIKVYPIDTTRLYVGGLSWGGIGTEALMMTYPNKFAAAFPCAGENWLNTVSVMTKTPFWIFHGSADGTVPVAKDHELISAVEAAKIDVSQFVSGANMANPTAISVDSLRKAVAGGQNYLYSEITGGDHGSGWHAAFDSPILVPWIMSKSKALGVSTFTWPAPGPRSGTVSLAPARQSAIKTGSGKAAFRLHGGVPVLEVSEADFSVTGKRLQPVQAVPGAK
jgi:predicted peptidase